MTMRSSAHVAPGHRTRIVAALIGLVFSATVVSGQDVVEPSPPRINPICDWAFSRAAERALASAPPTVAPDAGPSASPGPAGDVTLLDDTIRLCAGIEDWEAGAALHPEVLRETDPRSFLASRCSNTTAGLDAYATCVSLRLALATPQPTPEPTAEPDPEPSPTARPGAKQASKRAFLRRYCEVGDDYYRRRQQNLDLVFEVYEWYSAELLPSTLLAGFLGGAATRSRKIATRMERLPDYPPARNLVHLQVLLLREEAAMLRGYSEFARKPTSSNLDLAEKARAKRGSTSADVTVALLDSASKSAIAC